MNFGVAYYPEHWPETRWETDARLMVEAGFNMVRVAEFAWSRLEPQPGHYDFSWLDRALEVLHRHNIKVMMGTPTSNAPMWLFERYPDCLVVASDGRKAAPGGRYNACHNHSLHRELAKNLTQTFAEHYQDHPAIAGWHIHNEFGSAECFCANCQQAFHAWLQSKFGTLEQLNDTWGNVFWSLEYMDWSQVPVPHHAVGGQHPSLLLDYRRFYSDSVVAFAEELYASLHPHAGDRWILTNCQNFFKQNVDYYKLSRRMSIVATNNYPSSARDKTLIGAGLDLMRGIMDKGFWVVEQRSGMPGSVELGAMAQASSPGELRLWTYQAIGRGANHILYFRWRTARFGQEQYWHGLLHHDGVPRRLYHEAKQISEELERLAPLLEETRVMTPVALLHSYDQRWAISMPPDQKHYDYQEVFLEFHHALFNLGIQADIRPYDADLSPYRFVIVPLFYLTDNNLVERLDHFAREGGTIVFTFRSGVKDWHSVITDEPLPGKIAGLTGVNVVDYDAPPHDAEIKLSYSGSAEGELIAGHWVDVLELIGAKTLAQYESRHYKNQPAISVNKLGKGKVFYLGTRLTVTSLTTFLGDVLMPIMNPSLSWHDLPQSVEVLYRTGKKGTLVFLLNHGEQEVKVTVPNELRGKKDVLSGKITSATIDLPPAGTAIIMQDKLGA